MRSAMVSPLTGLVRGVCVSALLALSAHAQFSGNSQTNLISGVTSNWTGDYVVGSNTFADVLLIQNSGVLSNGTGYLGYEVSSSNNSVLVTDNGSVWSNNDSLYVGQSGAGNSLVVSNAGQVINSTGYLGYNSSSSNNRALVTGVGSVWNNSSTLLIGWSGSHNSLTISNGGQVINFGPGGYYSGIGGNSNSNLVEVTGTGSVWQCHSDTLYIGNNGASNSLVIRNGGNVVGNGGGVGAGQSSSNNSVLVTDSGSVWSNLGVSVGSAGWGNRLVVSNGAKVFSTGSGRVGASDFMKLGSNTVLVTGSGSVWSNGGDWTIGGYMWGNSVVVNGGGRLINNNGYVGSYPMSSSNNTMLVSDAGSVWTNRNDVRVGDGGSSNTLTVSNGGKVFSGYGYVGYTSGASTNSVQITGAGSLWTNRNDLVIGYSGARNSLLILSSGAVYSSIGYIGKGGTTAAPRNSVVVSGTGSVWRIVNGLYVGNGGAGNSLVISNGGQVITHFDNYVGYGSSSTGNSVAVTGPGSVWDNTDPFNAFSLCVGYSSAGNSLVISNGGKVLINNGTIGLNAGSRANHVLITGSGSVWSNSSPFSSFCLGYYGSGDSLVISNGGKLFNSYGFVGYDYGSGSNNSALVTGTGSVWRSDSLTIGRGGSSNTLVISNGGMVLDGSGSIASGNGRNDSVLVTGPGSVWSNTSLSVGDSGNGNSLVISNDAQVINGDAYVGYNFTVPPLPLSNEVRVADGGVWQNGAVYVGYGGSRNWLVVAGGSVLATSLVVGAASPTCDNFVELDGGNLFVSNSTGDATLEVRNGTFILNGGVLQADRLVMTNACGLFVRNGGTLTVGTAVLRPDLDADGDGIPNIWEQTYGLDPLNAADASADSGNGQSNLQVFQLTGILDSDGDGFTLLQELIAGTDPNDSASCPHITSVTQQGDDVEIDWAAVGGHSYVVQTNSTLDAGFSDASPVIAVPGVGPTTTNYLDLGTATNTPSLFYRVRLVP